HLAADLLGLDEGDEFLQGAGGCGQALAEAVLLAGRAVGAAPEGVVRQVGTHGVGDAVAGIRVLRPAEEFGHLSLGDDAAAALELLVHGTDAVKRLRVAALQGAFPLSLPGTGVAVCRRKQKLVAAGSGLAVPVRRRELRASLRVVQQATDLRGG